MTNKLTIIWDITKYCPMNCQICCMSATSNHNCITDELTYREKLNVVSQIAELMNNGVNVRADLSGGEILADRSHLRIISTISNLIGREQVGISTSGYKMDMETAKFLGKYVGDVEMTMDVVPEKKYDLRPKFYHETAAKAVPLLKAAGNKVGIQTVVCKKNNSFNDAIAMYNWCCDNYVDDWSIYE